MLSQNKESFDSIAEYIKFIMLESIGMTVNEPNWIKKL